MNDRTKDHVPACICVRCESRRRLLQSSCLELFSLAQSAPMSASTRGKLTTIARNMESLLKEAT